MSKFIQLHQFFHNFSLFMFILYLSVSAIKRKKDEDFDASNFRGLLNDKGMNRFFHSKECNPSYFQKLPVFVYMAREGE